jgi:small subunit ribosomal protein S15
MALTKEEKNNLVKEFSINENDTGSTEVQIALLTTNIRHLTDHCQKNPKDFSSKRGLLKMVCDRRTFLKYLERKNTQKYRDVIQKLGLRK